MIHGIILFSLAFVLILLQAIPAPAIVPPSPTESPEFSVTTGVFATGLALIILFWRGR
jgi:hypothetical protein